MYLDWTFAHIRHIARKHTICIYSNWIVKLNLIDSCSHYNEVQGINIELLTCIRNTVAKGNIGSYVVHQLKQSTYSYTWTWKLTHFSSHYVIVLKWKHDLIIAMRWSRHNWDIFQSISSLGYTYASLGTIKKCLYNSILKILICIQVNCLFRSIEKGCFCDWLHVFMSTDSCMFRCTKQIC